MATDGAGGEVLAAADRGRLATLTLLVILAACGDNCGPTATGRTSAATGNEHGGDLGSAGDPTLPGITRVDHDLDMRLRAALEAKGATYQPRTEHLDDQGRPLFVNRLILEGSPYLLQHAHNPVNWYTWGEEAFARARALRRPVFLSIGYSTCHWCHVMERESFENEEIATYLNEHFVAIKVDREDRPDLDDIYMRAVNVIAGRGGWPMTVLLTPDGDPFFGGTYFPPRAGARGSRVGLTEILEQTKRDYASDPVGVVARAQRLSQRVQALATPGRPAGLPGPAVLSPLAAGLARSFDAQRGGFGAAPKFPQPARLGILLRYHRRAADDGALFMATRALERMAAGGIYDQIGGGFHRYSVDADWLVPHFEKMLYDNAQLAVVYLDAYAVTGREDFATVARETLDYVAREMTAPDGGFYAATDADSPTPAGDEEEGYFFTFTPAEIVSVLGPEDGRLLSAVYGVSEMGNFEGRNILHRARALEDVAAELGLPVADARRRLERARGELYRARQQRPPPLRDEKILTAWNGLMISAYSRGGVVLGDASYVDRAARAACYLIEQVRLPDGKLARRAIGDVVAHRAYLDDYAFLVAGLLDLFEASTDPRWLREALRLTTELESSYGDGDDGGYFFTAHDQESLLARDKPSSDGAVPSGNSIAAHNLLRLALLTGDLAYRRRAEQALRAFADPIMQGAMPAMLAAVDLDSDAALEVVVVRGPHADDGELMTAARRTYVPNSAIVTGTEEMLSGIVEQLPWLAEKGAPGGRSMAYVCEEGRCELPTADPRKLADQLTRIRRPLASAPLIVPRP